MLFFTKIINQNKKAMFNKSEQRKLAYQMLVFDEVVKKGSFTEAADSLGHTKSAVSLYVTQLEAALETRLLNRSTRSLNLTSAGTLLAKRSEQLVDLLSDSLDELQAHHQAPSGRIAITAPHAFEPFLITPIIAKLVKEYPKLLPDLIYTDSRLDLLNNNLDMAITVGPQIDSNYNGILIGKLDSILVASPGYLAQNDTVTPSNLNQQTLIILPWQNKVTLTNTNKESIIFHSNKLLKVNTSISAINSVKFGAGIGLIPSIFVRSELESGQLQKVLPLYKGEQRSVYAIHAYQQQLPHILRLFVEKLKVSFTNRIE